MSIVEAPGASFPPADVSQLTFARKKDAKKYAAKCAVEWLRAEGFMPQGGARFPKGMATPHQQRLRQAQRPQPQPQPQAPGTPFARGGGAGGQLISPPVATTDRNTTAVAIPQSPFDPSQPSAVHQVSELCRDLGYPPPVYKITGDGPDFFDGFADFGDHRDLLPFDAVAVSSVRGVMGRGFTKETVAEQVLAALRNEKQKRDAENAAFMALYANGGKKD